MTLLQVAGLPPLVHTNSDPAESMQISPFTWVPLGLPAVPLGTSSSCARLPSNFPPYLPSPYTPLPLRCDPARPLRARSRPRRPRSPPRPHAGRRRPKSRSSPSGRPRRCRPVLHPVAVGVYCGAQHAVVASLAFYSRSGAVVFAKHGRSVRVTITDGLPLNQERRCPHLRTSSTQRGKGLGLASRGLSSVPAAVAATAAAAAFPSSASCSPALRRPAPPPPRRRPRCWPCP